MRWSTFRTPDGAQGVGVWRADELFPVPGARRLVDLLDSLEAAGDEAVRHSAALDPAAVIGPHADVAISPGSSAFDYELEVAAVIGRAGADLTPAQAVDHIAGFVLFCDWSARDLQGAEMALNLGPAKGKDSANGFGPWLVTTDELAERAAGHSYDIAMAAAVNGAEYSRGNLADLYWSFGEMIAYASRGTRVRPGDVIGSGTVGTGCILELGRVHGAERYPYLKAGDRVHLEAELLGAIDATLLPARPLVPLRAEATP